MYRAAACPYYPPRPYGPLTGGASPPLPAPPGPSSTPSQIVQEAQAVPLRGSCVARLAIPLSPLCGPGTACHAMRASEPRRSEPIGADRGAPLPCEAQGISVVGRSPWGACLPLSLLEPLPCHRTSQPTLRPLVPCYRPRSPLVASLRVSMLLPLRALGTRPRFPPGLGLGLHRGWPRLSGKRTSAPTPLLGPCTCGPRMGGSRLIPPGTRTAPPSFTSTASRRTKSVGPMSFRIWS